MQDILLWVLVVLVLFLAGLVVWLYTQLRKISRQNKALITAERDYKTYAISDEAVRFKLDPHLLKNALNTIQSHAYQSYYALNKLSNVLDFMLYESDVKWVKLKDEIAFAQNLIEINRLKVSPLFDLHVRLRIPTEAENLLVPPFISINPIENAFKHADLQHDDSFISVVYEVKGDRLTLMVSNKIAGYTTNKDRSGGLGNKAFLARLRAIYGDAYNLDIDQNEGIYTLRLELKLQEHDQMYTG